jgi:AraC-like DNA-binding protein
MLLHPTCEPINLPVETMARVDRVRHPARSPSPSPFLHFHDVVEVILFEQARGHMICDGRRFEIAPTSAAIVPSMMYHDFVLASGSRDWILIQIDPYQVERALARTGLALQPNSVIVTESDQQRLKMLAIWLDEALGGNKDASLVEEIISLLVTTLCKYPVANAQPASDVNTDVERFIPAIEQLRRHPGQPFSLRDAATLCSLSPAYFSRRFAAIFGCGFGDYVASYRLHLAARHVATTNSPFSTIGYELGFSSPSHFAERYRERFGISPREYRKRVRDAERD